ncbi:MAG: YhbY family RNA-binding protein [Sulfuricellaceae bacterium]|nr:YhbY family RNA-binding protein [Sulfuricellaceae bacterium]
MLNLTPGQRRFLRAQAHTLNPVVMIGDAGLSASVMKEIGASLKSHELIKIKIAGGDREQREAMLNEICTTLDAAPIQHIGKTLIVYKTAEKPVLVLPKS